MKEKSGLTDMFTIEVEVSKQNLLDKVKYGKMALQRLDLLKDKITAQLYEVLLDSLAGYSKEMQQEMAECMVDFYFFKVMTFTGCPFVDLALLNSYYKIGVELRIVKTIEH